MIASGNQVLENVRVLAEAWRLARQVDGEPGRKIHRDGGELKLAVVLEPRLTQPDPLLGHQLLRCMSPQLQPNLGRRCVEHLGQRRQNVTGSEESTIGAPDVWGIV